MIDAFVLSKLAIGVSVGMTYAIVAIGLTLTYRVLSAVNFAHGEVYTLGAFATLVGATVLKLPPPRSWIRLPSITEASESKKKLQCAVSRPSSASASLPQRFETSNHLSENAPHMQLSTFFATRFRTAPSITPHAEDVLR